MKTTMQCDRCGGEMRLSEDGLRAKCPYCNHEILFRSPKGEALLLALARANSFRRDSRFSDAIREYKLITEENPEDAEAFWGLVLSTYGIEYVKDPRTSRYVPTCHRAVRGSILEDDNYLRAIGSATEEQRADYTEQANEIDRLQKDILRRTENAEDFDVFISFKSTDDMGNSTKDAQIARTIYDELVKRGFKTFFSDVTLNDMVFSDYEPVIFRALYSCKFFILVATKPEYVTAPWVENEWSRFEQRMEEEKLSGVACAVFDGRAVRDLPPFLRAQGIDLNRHAAGGYEVLLADSIERKLGRSAKSRSDEELKKQLEEQKRHQAEIEERLSSIGGSSATVKSLLMRAEQELEMGKQADAQAYYTRVLDIQPSCGEAWWGLFLMDMDVKSEDAILGSLTPQTLSDIRANKNYTNAVKYATGACAERIEAFNKELFNGERWWKMFLREMGAATEDEIIGKLDVSVLKMIRKSVNLEMADKYADDALKVKLFAFRKAIYLRLKENMYPAEKSSHEEFLQQWDKRADAVQAVANQKVKKSQEFLKASKTLDAKKEAIVAEVDRLTAKVNRPVFLWGLFGGPKASIGTYIVMFFIPLVSLYAVASLPFRILLFPVLAGVRSKANKELAMQTEALHNINTRISDLVSKMKSLTEEMNKDTDRYKAESQSLKKTDIEYKDRLSYYRAYYLVLNDEWHFEAQTAEESQEAKASASRLSDSQWKNKSKGTYNVVLQHMGRSHPVEVIKAVSEFTGLAFTEARETVKAMGTIWKGVSKEGAEAAVAKLKELGAVAIVQENL